MKPDKSNHIAHSSLMICHYILTLCTKLCTFLINSAMWGLSCATQDLILWHVDSVVVVQGLSRLAACGILVPSLGSHPHPLHCKAASQPMDHEGSSHIYVFVHIFWHSQIELAYPPLGRRQWHPTPVLLPRKSHGWRSLVGCSPWGCTESDTTEAT